MKWADQSVKSKVYGRWLRWTVRRCFTEEFKRLKVDGPRKWPVLKSKNERSKEMEVGSPED